MPEDPADRLLRFGRFEISPAERLVRVDGGPVALGARAFDLLLTLARRRERVVTKQELLDQVWPGVVVEEHNIAAQISTLRKLLGAGAIATIPGRGYKLTAVLEPPPAAPEPAATSTSISSSTSPAPQPHHAGMNAGTIIANGMVYVPYGGQNNPSGGTIAYPPLPVTTVGLAASLRSNAP